MQPSIFSFILSIQEIHYPIHRVSTILNIETFELGLRIAAVHLATNKQMYNYSC